MLSLITLSVLTNLSHTPEINSSFLGVLNYILLSCILIKLYFHVRFIKQNVLEFLEHTSQSSQE